MTDTEIIIACAKAMGYTIGGQIRDMNSRYPVALRVSEGRKAPRWYSPLYDDAQAMMLVKFFSLQISGGRSGQCWEVIHGYNNKISATSVTLNNAICECVAKMGMLKDINRARSGTENDQ